jgi:hypothetical protein
MWFTSKVALSLLGNVGAKRMISHFIISRSIAGPDDIPAQGKSAACRSRPIVVCSLRPAFQCGHNINFSTKNQA